MFTSFPCRKLVLLVIDYGGKAIYMPRNIVFLTRVVTSVK